MTPVNTAVLIIDDEEMVRDNIEEILIPQSASEDELNVDEAFNLLFDAPKPLIATRTPNIPVFTVEKAPNGMEGVKLVKEAFEAGNPYAVIFLDMRMPGWNGLETAMEIRKYDQKAEIIFITAYSDRSIDEIIEQAGQNVGYHCKPYAPEEIIQLATKAVTDYNKLRNLEKLIESISSIGLNKQQLNPLLKNILDQLANSVETDVALMGKLNEDFTYEQILSIGALDNKINTEELIARVKSIDLEKDSVIQVEELFLARMDKYTVFALLKKHEKLKTEKLYLLKLFVQNAAQAIRNAELNETLMQKEKLSAVGQVIGMVMHDLRTPIKNIKVITGLIREEGNDSDLIDMIDQSAEQASEIFDDFIDFVNNTPIKKVPLALHKVIADAIDLANNRDGVAFINITKDVSEDIFVQGDESKLRRAFSNLINNAVDALRDHNVPNACIDITVSTSDKMLFILIKDNGPGIPQEIVNTLFDPFVTKKKSNGTGLGLAIVKQYINSHGGDISVENNNGAIFTISLPYTK